MKTFNEKQCLEVDPLWNQDVKSLKRLADKIVVTRIEHTCSTCFGTIKKKEPARSVSESFGERKIKSFYFCNECCYAMAEFWSDGGKAWDARVEIGKKIALKKAEEENQNKAPKRIKLKARRVMIPLDGDDTPF